MKLESGNIGFKRINTVQYHYLYLINNLVDCAFTRNYFIAKSIAMLSIAECRKILGKKFQNCTDQQIEKIRELLSQFAKMEVKRITKRNK